MKQFLLVAAAATAMAITGCKTTEANYRAAYEATAAHRDSRADAEADFLSRSDSTAVTTVFISPVKVDPKADAVTPEKALPFNVAVNRFKQVFNAKALCRRLRDNGWPTAYVARTADDEYFVMAVGAATQAEATALCDKVRADKSVPADRGYPAIVRSAR